MNLNSKTFMVQFSIDKIFDLEHEAGLAATLYDKVTKTSYDRVIIEVLPIFKKLTEDADPSVCYQFVRFRPDKSRANPLPVIEAVLENIQNNFSLEKMIKMFNSKMKPRYPQPLSLADSSTSSVSVSSPRFSPMASSASGQDQQLIDDHESQLSPQIQSQGSHLEEFKWMSSCLSFYPVQSWYRVVDAVQHFKQFDHVPACSSMQQCW